MVNLIVQNDAFHMVMDYVEPKHLQYEDFQPWITLNIKQLSHYALILQLDVNAKRLKKLKTMYLLS